RRSARFWARSKSSMDALPCVAQFRQTSGQIDYDPPHVVPSEAIILPQLWRSLGTVQVEDRFAPCTYNVDMRRSMVIWVDRHPKAVETQDRGHGGIYAKRLGFPSGGNAR